MILRLGRSLSGRLTAVIFVGSLLPLVAVLSIAAVRDVRHLRDEKVAESRLIARLVADYATADLAFEDREQATRTLANLQGRDDVLYAALYGARGQMFASFVRPDLASTVAPPATTDPTAGPTVVGLEDSLVASHPVVQGGERFGTLQVRLSIATLGGHIRAYFFTLIAAALALAAISLGVAFALQRLITRPILGLARAARAVTETQDYSVRAGRSGSDEIGFLSTAFDTMLAEIERRQKEAQEAIRVRDEFLSVASHELMTPIGTLRLSVDLLTHRLQDSDALMVEPLAACKRQVARIEALVANLLDVTRISGGQLRLEYQDVDLVEVARDALARYQPELARAGAPATLTAPAPVRGRWDRLRLEQVIANLLSNVVKYGGGRPFSVRVVAEEDRAVLEVKDQGMGIPADELPRIFERFERGSEARNLGGLGLGLYIAREIVVGLGGRIRAESEPGMGSTFTVELPLRK